MVKMDAKTILHIVITLFIMALSYFVLANYIPQMGWVQESLESVDKSNLTVMGFTGATTSASVAISALPEDFGTPLANVLAGMDKYFIFILAVLFIERVILTTGIGLAFKIIIPIAGFIYILACVTNKRRLINLVYKFAVLGLAIAMVVPASTHMTEAVGAEYLTYVDQTIEETNIGAGKINEVMEENDTTEETIFDKLSNAFKTAIQSVNDLVDYFRNVIKKCMNAIAILLVTTFIVPLLTALFFRWLLSELFSIVLPMPNFNEEGRLAGLIQKSEDRKGIEG